MPEPNHHSARRSFVGSLIQQDREQAGLSLSQYAEIVRVSRSYISLVEQGRYAHPSPEILVRIAEARHICLADLFLAAGYLLPSDMPSFLPYLHAVHPEWPESAYDVLMGHFEYLEHKYKQDPKPKDLD